MAVSDSLLGGKFEFADSLSIMALQIQNYALTYKAGSETFTGFNMSGTNASDLVIIGGKVNGPGAITPTTLYSNGSWLSASYQTITVLGGNAATNSALQVFFGANATEQFPTKTFDLSSLGLSIGHHSIQVKCLSDWYKPSSLFNDVDYNKLDEESE